MVPVAVAFGVTSAIALLALAVGVWLGREWAAVRAAGRAWPDVERPEDWEQVDWSGDEWPTMIGRRGRGRE